MVIRRSGSRSRGGSRPLPKLGADPGPPFAPRGLVLSEVSAGHEFEREDLRGDCIPVIRLDLERPVEMLQRRGDLALLHKAGAEPGPGDLGGRILLEHLAASLHGRCDIVPDHTELGLAQQRHLQQRVDRQRRVEIHLGLIEPADLLMQPAALGKYQSGMWLDRERGIERSDRLVEMAQIDAGQSLAIHGLHVARIER